jgi:hypothetical protein
MGRKILNDELDPAMDVVRSRTLRSI